MERKKNSVFKEIIEACEFHGIKGIMGFRYNWNQEIVSQFYSTVYFDERAKKLTWITEGERYSCTLSRFATLLGIRDSYDEPKCIHDGRIMLPSVMKYMYVNEDDCNPPYAAGFKPFYNVLHRMVRVSIAPMGGNVDHVPSFEKDLLDWIGGSMKFNVFDFIYSEMWHMAITASRGCAYAPFIMFMIEKVTKKTFKKECEHKSLKRNIPSGATRGASTPRQAPSSEPNSPLAPSARSTPDLSHRRRGSGSSKKRGGLFKMLRGLFSIYNRLDARLDNIKKRQDVLNKRRKTIYDHLAIQLPRSPSPIPAPYPPLVENPWSTFTDEESQYFGYFPSYAYPTTTAGTRGAGPSHTRFDDEDEDEIMEETPP
ncbi:hypothetical protein QOZ80_9BG0708810 [Eleusine coracana subsp. coracana]|nr:hypothetical protein QOZ80_9BG0708810 [Eleusine coracana subsp. coracana]